MARMHTRKRGKSGSTRMALIERPSWIQSDDEIKEEILKFKKEGLSNSMIGIKLRDQYTVPGVRPVLHQKMAKILEENGIKDDIPEDLAFLLKRYKNVSKHLLLNSKDISNKRGSQLIMSKILRLMRYYKRTGRLSADWSLKRAL
ncbi:30S ribosomal protein S15 [Ferroplasma sp.]|uniref:30S ribosomal protein S15 n=1 Tax=Ferroplasma sp. TaxID=2591003 RepID=UPI00307F8108